MAGGAAGISGDTSQRARLACNRHMLLVEKYWMWAWPGAEEAGRALRLYSGGKKTGAN